MLREDETPGEKKKKKKSETERDRGGLFLAITGVRGGHSGWCGGHGGRRNPVFCGMHSMERIPRTATCRRSSLACGCRSGKKGGAREHVSVTWPPKREL